MAAVNFYHLTRSGTEETLRALLDRALAQGWRVMVRSPREDRLARLDEALWREPEDGFLPHGREEGPDAARQPVLLGRGAAVNGARGLFLIDGAETTAAEAAGMERVWLLFDGTQAEALIGAREQWKRLVAAGIQARYWAEEGGKWVCKAEAPAPRG
jgi:DNA polymerase-3 subunit chi